MLSGLAAEKASLSTYGMSPEEVSHPYGIYLLCLAWSTAGPSVQRCTRRWAFDVLTVRWETLLSADQICTTDTRGHTSAGATRRTTTGRLRSASQRGDLPTAVGRLSPPAKCGSLS